MSLPSVAEVPLAQIPAFLLHALLLRGARERHATFVREKRTGNWTIMFSYVNGRLRLYKIQEGQYEIDVNFLTEDPKGS